MDGLIKAASADAATALSGSALWKAQMEFLRPTQASRSDNAVAYPTGVPATFDGTAVWRKYRPSTLPRLCGCGASWAAAATYALTIRYRVWTNNQVRQRDYPGARKTFELSFGKVAACNYGGIREYTILDKAMRSDKSYQEEVNKLYGEAAVGCTHVETLLGAWQYLLRFGAVRKACVPDAAFGICDSKASVNDVSGVVQCSTVLGDAFGRCADGTAAQLYRAGGFYTLPHSVRAIQREVWKWGPVTSAMEVTRTIDAHADMRGVYAPPQLRADRPDLAPRANDDQKHRDRVEEVQHGVAVVIMGWGTLGGVDYWLVAAWDRGFMRVARGINAGGIEENVVAGYPDVPMAAMFMPYTTMASEVDTFVANIWPVHASGYKDIVIEEELLRGHDLTHNVLDLVTEDMIPNYKDFVAGEPWGVRFPYRGNIWRAHPDVYYLLILMLLAAIVVVGVWAVTV